MSDKVELREGDEVKQYFNRKWWTGTIDEIYDDKATVVWDETGCATDDIPLSELVKLK